MESSVKKFFNRMQISDLILILVCLFAAYIVYRQQSIGATKVYIYKNERLFGEYALHKDKSIFVDEHNTVIISAGKAAISFSDCPDKRCVKQGFNNSLPIICVPNRLVLEFKNAEKDRKLILQ